MERAIRPSRGRAMTPSRVVERWPDGQDRVTDISLGVPGLTASLQLPSTGTLTLFLDTREQATASIIQETINAENFNRGGGGDFTYRQNPPSVDIEPGVNAINPLINKSLIHDGTLVTTDGVMTMMVLVKPEDISPRDSGPQAYLVEYSNGNNILLDQNSNDEWSYFVAGARFNGDDPSTNTDMPATQSVWQTVCYVNGPDGANKQTGYLNGVLGAGPLNKSFDLVSSNGNMEIGFVGVQGAADWTGSFGGYLHWTSSLSAGEVAEAHNFFRSISADYGLPEA